MIFNPKVNYTLIKGRHSIKLGYEFQEIHTELNDFNPSYGQDNYAGTVRQQTATPQTPR